LAHLVVKKHTWRFWKIVGIIYPEYEKGKEELLRIVREELMKRDAKLNFMLFKYRCSGRTWTTAGPSALAAAPSTPKT
jgi:hypothetical protein